MVDKNLGLFLYEQFLKTLKLKTNMINKFYPTKPIIDYKKTSIDFEKFIEFSYNSDYGKHNFISNNCK